MTSKVYRLDEMKRQGNLDNSVSIPQWKNLYLKGRHSLRQNGTHTLSPLHVAKDEEDHGSAAGPAPRSTGHRSCTGFLTLLPAKCSHPGLGCPDTFYNGWSSAQGVISCRVVLLFQCKWHNSSPQGVTMVGATFISHSNASCLKSTLKLFLLQSALYKSILV